MESKSYTKNILRKNRLKTSDILDNKTYQTNDKKNWLFFCNWDLFKLLVCNMHFNAEIDPCNFVQILL